MFLYKTRGLERSALWSAVGEISTQIPAARIPVANPGLSCATDNDSVVAGHRVDPHPRHLHGRQQDPVSTTADRSFLTQLEKDGADVELRALRRHPAVVQERLGDFHFLSR